VKRSRLGFVVFLLVLGLPATGAAGPTVGMDVAGVAARVLPAVVSITTRHLHEDSPERRVLRRGLGSGVIVDRRGFVLTNHHVVEGAEVIKVALPDGRAFTGRLVGADPATDLAVVKIDGERLPVAVLGDSARLRVGEPVIAIGNPLWIEGGPTVTAGVVSGLGRSMEQPGLPLLHGLIQTDAAINEGNSGGPLVNRAGHVVGINTAVIASAHGIGFAIASNTVKPVLREIVARGSIVRPGLGLVAVSVTPQLAFVEELPVERGVLVIEVAEGGPAAAAGVQPRDVVMQVAGRAVKHLHDYHEAIWSRRPGEAIELTVRRGDETLALRAVLAADADRRTRE
jgi:serine protease Do